MMGGLALFVILCRFSSSFAAQTLSRREQKAMVVEFSGVSEDGKKKGTLIRSAQRHARSAESVESSGFPGSVQDVQKEPETTTRDSLSVDPLGMIQKSNDGDESKNMPERSNVRGPVADALHNAKAELDNQITEQEKAKSDTDLALQRAVHDKEAKESEFADAEVQINYWTNKRAELEVAIQNSTDTISGLSNLSNDQQAEIDRLRLAAAAKHDAAGMAEELEELTVSLTDQISQKEQLKVETEARHKEELEKQQQDCDAAYETSTEGIANLTTRINEAQAELDLLTELHTEASCLAKQAKNERICKRCSIGEEPCGDTCVAADETCHHDLGCACKEDGDGTLLQLDPSEDDDPHPVRAQLENAKAELRKIIAQHQETINSLQGDIKQNEDETAEVESQKQQALADYERSLKALGDQKAELSNASAAAQASKEQAEEELVAALSSGEAAIENLKTQLESSIAELKNERAATEDARATQVTTCEEEKKALQDSQGNVISALVAEIDQLKQQKKDAEDQLELMKQEHGVVDDTATTRQPTTPAPTTSSTDTGNSNTGGNS